MMAYFFYDNYKFKLPKATYQTLKGISCNGLFKIFLN